MKNEKLIKYKKNKVSFFFFFFNHKEIKRKLKKKKKKFAVIENMENVGAAAYLRRNFSG